MTEKEKQTVCNVIDNEGFDYGFRHYSSFKEIDDIEFHSLRKKYIKVAEDLEKYIDWEKYQQ